MRPKRFIPALAFLVLLACQSVASAQPVSFTRVDVPNNLPPLLSIIARDIDGDGMLDLLVSSHSIAEPFGIYVLKGHGDGTFASPETVFVPPTGSALSVGDVNGDGHIDILFLLGFDLWALLGDGHGAFPTVIQSEGIGGSGGRPLLITDLNGDGKVDVTFVHQNGGVTVALGNGDGRFRPGVTYPITGGFAATGVAAADFNEDGTADLAATNLGASDGFVFLGDTVSVLLGNGDGTFGPPADFPVEQMPLQVVARDFNGDGHADLAVANYLGQSVSVLLGLGNGTFLPATDYPANAPETIDTADFNGDSHLDLVACAAPEVIAIFPGQGNGSFGAREDIPAAGFCGSVVTGDFNRDGRIDMAEIYSGQAGTISIFLNTTPLPDTTSPVITATATPEALWPANGKTVDVIVSGTVADMQTGVDLSSGTFVVSDEYGLVHPAGGFTIGADGNFSFSIPLTASRRGDDSDGRAYVVTITARDRAGNPGSTVVRVIVPHDHGR